MAQPKVIQFKKPIFPVSNALNEYLQRHTRSSKIPIEYDDLKHFTETIPKLDEQGQPTLWSTVMFHHYEIDEIYDKLVDLYQILVADGGHLDYLRVDSVDFCMYGNSQPFRIKILNELNDNFDYYYIKKADSSRIYGLELEHLLSPNRINFIHQNGTLVEEHIIGIPGDDFIDTLEKYNEAHDEVRLAKEFVKFNERCFIRLLGDMRAYNFVVVVNQDFDRIQYRIRCIDFDQQCYEGRHRLYLPQFFKDNLYYVQLTQRNMSIKTATQYVNEEQALTRRRYRLAEGQLNEIFELMRSDYLSKPAYVKQLAQELSTFHKDAGFKKLSSMGQLLERNIKVRLGI